MPTSKLANHGWKILFLAIAAFYFYGLGSLPLVGPDEPRYAQVAREMLQRGDFITPTLGGLPWFEKPPLPYWLMMAAYRVFGVTEFAARVGPAICGLVTAVFIFWAGKNISAVSGTDSRAVEPGVETLHNDLGRWSAFAFLSSLGAIVFSRGATFDMVLTMTLAGAFCCFFVWNVGTATDTERAPWFLLVGFYLFIGLSMLAKGLVGPVLAFGVITVYFLLRREWPSKTFVRSLLWGVPVAVVVAGIWYGPMIYRHRWTFVDQFFLQHHFARFVSNKYRHPQRFYFYVPVLAMLLVPWTTCFVAALMRSRRWRWRGLQAVNRLHVFAFSWLAVPLIFFSFSGSKIPGYVLPVLPAASLLIGERITSYLRDNRGERLIRITGALLVVGAAFGVSYSVRTLAVPIGSLTAVAVSVVIVALVALFAPRKRALNFLLFGVMAVVISGIALLPARTVANRESVRELMRAADARGYGAAPVFYLLCDDRTAEFYAGGRLAYQANGEPVRFEGAQELPPAIRAKGDAALVLMETRWEKQLTDYAAVRTERIGSNGWVTLFVVRVR